jgi:hypothetical protein
MITDMLLDPFLNSFVTANTNILLLCVNLNDDKDVQKTLYLASKLAIDRPPSTIKYQSQVLLLQSGHYQ